MASNSTSWVPRRGDVIAEKYRVEELIGMGGMGAVLRATHLTLLQSVAIKVLKPDDDPTSVTRFLREARAAAALSNPHVMKVLDVGEMTSEMPYFVMELLQGENLAQRLSRPPVSQEELLEIFTQVCDGLGEAHAKGIVHRDIKPSNIFLVAPSTSSKGKRSDILAKVLDFGIAKPIDPHVSVEQSLTGTSQVLGTPRYMSPEHISSTATADARADVWAVGVSLYEALAGRPPFEGANAYEVGAQILTREPPPIRSLRADVTQRFAIIIERCLRKNPAERYADANELLAVLQGPAPPASEPTLLIHEPPPPTGASTPVLMSAVAATAQMPGPIASRDAPPKAGRPLLLIVAAMVLGLSAAGVAVGVLRSKQPAAAQPLVPSAAAVALAPEDSAEPEEEPPVMLTPIPSPPSSVATTEPPPAARRTTKPRRPPRGPTRHASPAITAAPDER